MDIKDCDVDTSLKLLNIQAFVNDAFIMVCPTGEIVKIESNGANLIGQISDGILACSWSPSSDIMALVTGKHQLILMTSSEFDVIYEGPVETDGNVNEKFVNVGWGKKETQFHGTAGKQAAQSKEMVLMRPAPSDDGIPRISWRGDGELLAITQVDISSSARRIRVFDKFGTLQSISEPVGVLESSLCWMPNGALITSTTIHPDGRRQVIFFERNGLRHGEFFLRRSEAIKDLSWNTTSDVLAVLFEDGLVELWTSKNYHWYLKASFSSYKNISWIDSKLVLMKEDEIRVVELQRIVTKSQTNEKDRLSVVAVLDGANVLLTPFGIANVPPPMSLGKFICDSNPTAVSLYSIPERTEFLLAFAVGPNLTIQRATLANGTLSFELVNCAEEPDEISQLVFNEDYLVCKLVSGQVSVYSHSLDHYSRIDCPIDSILSNCGSYVQFFNGQIMNLATTEYESYQHPKGFCSQLETFETIDHYTAFVGVSDNRLFAGHQEICHGVSFIYQLPEFIVLGMEAEKSIRFVPKSKPISQWPSILQATDEESTRRIEMGSQIMTSSIPSSSIVLQAPRGNLETIYPRALVLASVRRFISALDYLSAYMECRRHRLDLNILFDVAPTTFLQTVDLFINQIKKVDFLNLFVAGLKDENTAVTKYPGFGLFDGKDNMTEDKVNLVCTKIRDELLKRDDHGKYVETVMTTFVCQKPPRFEAALQTIIDLTVTAYPETLEKCLTYIIFLVDATTLYDVALGLYHLPLALSIARRSQKDPKEYVQFLEELSSVEDESLRCFRIDAYLGKYENALNWYWNCLEHGSSEMSFDGFLEFMHQHQLYKHAINLVNDDRIKIIYKLFADHRRSVNDPVSAASLYRLAAEHDEAIAVCVESGAWQQATAMAKDIYQPDQFQELVGDLYAKLIDQRRFLEAFNLAMSFVTDEEMRNEGALTAAISGSLWLEALTIPFVDVSIVIGEALKAADNCSNELTETCQAFEEKSERLLLLQRQFLEPTKETSNAATEISDSLSEMSFRSGAASTIITRTSAYSGTTTQRNKKKQERKKMRAKPGSPFERDGLRLLITEQIEKVKRIQSSIQPLLIVLSEHDHRKIASQLQSSLDSLSKTMSSFSKTFRQLQEKLEFKHQHDIINLPREIMNDTAIAEETEGRYAWHTAFILSSEFISGFWKLDYI